MQFATKPELARLMLGRALDAGVPAAWVTADEAYGKDGKFRAWLEQRRIGYVVAVAATRPSAATPGPPAPTSWPRTPPARHGSAAAAATAPKAPGSTTGRPPPCPTTAPSRPAGPGTCWSAARSPANAKGELELAYYLCCAPAGTADEELIRVAGSRWAVEECFQTAKTETGLDQYQVRRYDAWYRHVTLAMLAHAYLAVTAATAPKALAAASSRSRSARSAVSWHT